MLPFCVNLCYTHKKTVDIFSFEVLKIDVVFGASGTKFQSWFFISFSIHIIILIHFGCFVSFAFFFCVYLNICVYSSPHRLFFLLLFSKPIYLRRRIMSISTNMKQHMCLCKRTLHMIYICTSICEFHSIR